MAVNLHPQAKAIIEMMAALGGPVIHESTPEEFRAYYDSRQAPPTEDVHEIRDLSAGGVPSRLYRPSAAKDLGLLVYYHGGGWTVGDLDTHDSVTRALARDAECIVVSVDYRMGPEHRFPCAVDDALAAFAWVAAEAAGFGGDPSRLAVGGDSAGGNLSAVVAQQTLAAGARTPDFQLLVYPVTDLGAESHSYELFADGFYLTRDLMRWFSANYLGDRNAPAAMDPRASPLRAESLAGLAPAFLLTAGYDPLRDEGKAYAERLLDAEYRNYDSLIHGFFSMTGVVREARHAYDDAVAALRIGLGTDR